MALRHLYPGSEVGLVPRDDLDVAAVMRPAQTVEFRVGADMAQVVREIGNSQTVILDAAVGAGKSTRFPGVYARVARSLTFHVVPNPLLALDLYHYAVKRADETNDAPVMLMDSIQLQIPRTGVVYLSSAMMVAVMVKHGSLRKLGDVTVFLDEAHESDAYTYVVRTLATNMGAMRLIMASATMSPGGARARETPGTIVERRFDAMKSPGDWDVLDSKAPWYCGNNLDNCLIFLDSHSQSKRLAEAYRRMGYLAFRLESGMEPGKFLEAMKALRDVKGQLVVLIADYSFRSGFTFDVSLVIDTGSVALYDPTPGRVAKVNRKMYENESIQAAGRAGRLKKGNVQYWRPDTDLPKRICDLEGVEREAAAYIYRCLGFKPVGILADTLMSRADLPKEAKLPDALNMCYPLTYHVVGSDGQIRPERIHVAQTVSTPVPESVAESFSRHDSAATTVVGAHVDGQGELGSYFADKLKILDSPIERGRISDDVRDDTVAQRTPDHFMQAFFGDAVAQELVVGNYYLVQGITPSSKPSFSFPNGVRSVRRMLVASDGDLKVGGMSKKDRVDAISLVTAAYNHANIEHDAITAFVERAYSDGHTNLKHAVRDYMTAVLEEYNGLKADRRDLLSCIDMLAYKHFEVVSVKPLQDCIDQRVEDRWKTFEKMNNRRDSANIFDDSFRQVLRDRDKPLMIDDRQRLPRHVSESKPRNDEMISSFDRHRSYTRTVYTEKRVRTKMKPGLYLARVKN